MDEYGPGDWLMAGLLVLVLVMVFIVTPVMVVIVLPHDWTAWAFALSVVFGIAMLVLDGSKSRLAEALIYVFGACSVVVVLAAWFGRGLEIGLMMLVALPMVWLVARYLVLPVREVMGESAEEVVRKLTSLGVGLAAWGVIRGAEWLWTAARR
jgi:hypothetical protein